MRKSVQFLAVFVLISFGMSLFVCGSIRKELRDSVPIILKDALVIGHRSLRSSNFPVQVMEGKALQQLSSESVADALRYFSGIQIKDYGGIGGLKTINLHALGTQHVGIFYDGIELGNAQNGQIDLGRFSLDNLESISLFNGQRDNYLQSASDYGSAGTVYLESKIPNLKDTPYHLKSKIKTGSFDLVNPSVYAETRFSNTITASVSASYLYTSGKYNFTYAKKDSYDTTAVRQNGDVRALCTEFGLFGHHSNSDWKMKAYYYHSKRGLPGAIVRNRLVHEDRQWDNNFFVQMQWKQFSKLNGLQFKFKGAYDYLHYATDPIKDVGVMYVDSRYHQYEGFASISGYHRFNNIFTLSVASDYNYNIVNSDRQDFGHPNRHKWLTALSFSAHYKEWMAQTSLLQTMAFNQNNGEHSNFYQLKPALSIDYTPKNIQGLHLRLFYKDVFRLPTLNDLYYTFIGNADLAPEKTQQYNLGLTYVPRIYSERYSLRFKVDVYHHDVENKIVAVPTSNQFRWTMMNLGKVCINGLDISILSSFNVSRDLSFSLRTSYSYQDAYDHTSPEDSYYYDQIPYIPKHSGSAVVGADYKRWHFNYSFLYTGDRYDQKMNSAENAVPEWYTSDCMLSYVLPFMHDGLKITGEANNIFNQQYDVVKGYPMPGRNFKIILAVEL